jgi:hypothetical protein
VNALHIYEQLYAPKSLPQAPSDLKMSRLSYSQSVSNTSMPSIFYSAASRRLAKARALNPVSPSSSSSSGLSDSSRGSHELPTGEFSVVGVPFEVDFERVYRRSERLNGARLSYKVRHKSLLKGARESAPF